ncbi:radical SAM family heme chaperone HemW [Psychrobacter sp. I-STPA6b]|uniref:radical SAM family heme chaperone HemW n=1 Tax=Psychrobacter sp. I-STPA6b TaxID=2585718 RepID=UPI001D0CC9B1|nr:radical SAM family heme chaperone HemW [Psychrobacter sp. I-STPA6b]
MSLEHTDTRPTLHHHVQPVLDISKIPLALYIHIPWCVRKCPYCDFNSHAQKTPDLRVYHDYVTALMADIDEQIPWLQNRQISSIFIGGGTPSLLPIVEYKRLFAYLQSNLPLSDDIEVTMEANPGTLEHAPFAQYLEVGINRLSIGVQSFSTLHLEKLGRIHNPQQAEKAIASARKAGFRRVNVDLMHGLPNQTVTEAFDDLKRAHEAGATHLSWYQLTIEPNTVFYRQTPVLPSEDTLADIEERGREQLLAMGYHNYEISAWVGRDDNPCRHNLNYWQFGDYLAIGAGAHGKISLQRQDKQAGGIYRFSRSRQPKDYINFVQYPKLIGWQAIKQDELAGEFMMNTLRLTQGIDKSLFYQRTGQDFSQIEDIWQSLKKRGLLIEDDDIIAPTMMGQRYLNHVMQAFI